MSTCRWMLALGMVCLATISFGQDQAARVLGPHWREISRASGMVFSGTVLSVAPQAMDKGRPLPVIVTKFRVDRAIVGVARGEVVTVREWAGAWDAHRAMSTGERFLLFLYPPSRLGLTSPVGGRVGLAALDGRGEIVAPYFLEFEQNREAVAPPTVRRPAPPDLAVSLRRNSDAKSASSIPLWQLEREIRSARGNLK